MFHHACLVRFGRLSSGKLCFMAVCAANALAAATATKISRSGTLAHLRARGCPAPVRLRHWLERLPYRYLFTPLAPRGRMRLFLPRVQTSAYRGQFSATNLSAVGARRVNGQDAAPYNPRWKLGCGLVAAGGASIASPGIPAAQVMTRQLPLVEIEGRLPNLR